MIDPVIFENECVFKTSRSSGKGGQHVNKTETKVSLYFDVTASSLLNDEEKERVLLRLSSYIIDGQYLQLQCSTHRSQIQNKQLVVERAIILLHKALTVAKPRKPSKPTRASVEKRLEDKRRTAIKKIERNK